MLFLFMLLTFLGCSARSSATPITKGNQMGGQTPLRIYAPDLALPLEILNQFSAETGIAVTLQNNLTQEQLVANIQGGELYDLVLLDTFAIVQLRNAAQLRPLDHTHLPNFKNISPSFRDLAFDPQNQYTIPFIWGLYGLIMPTELSHNQVAWADLFVNDGSSKGYGLLSHQKRVLLGVSLKALGYSANTSNRTELEAATNQITQNKKRTQLFYGYGVEELKQELLLGRLSWVIGRPQDVPQPQSGRFSFIIPQEGPLLWSEQFAIPRTSKKTAEAEQLLNYLLIPAVMGQIITANHFANANEAAYSFVSPQLLANSYFFPTQETLQSAEAILPLDPSVESIYQEMWERFLVSH